MDISTITAVGGLVVAAAGVSVAVFALEPGRRSEWVSFCKKWLTVVFVIVMTVNSVIGIYLFVQGPPQLVRSDIFNLALHLFHLLSLPVIWFFDAMGKVMDARTAKGVELTEKVEVLKRQIEGLEGRLQGDAKALA
jgi:CBS domain containing-hemolysin-like protein